MQPWDPSSVVDPRRRCPLHERFEIGGVDFRALGRTDRLLHSAYHLLLGSREPALMNLRDLACYLTDERLGPDEVLPRVRQWRGETVVAMAIDLLAERLEVDLGPWARWRQSMQLDPAEVALVQRQRAEGSSLGRAKLDVARELPRWRDRAAYLAALAWPSRAHLASRGLTRRDVLSSLAHTLWGLRRR